MYRVGKSSIIPTNTRDRTGNLMDHAHKGPYIITKVNVNGTVHVKRGNYLETLNIRKLWSFYL